MLIISKMCQNYFTCKNFDPRNVRVTETIEKVNTDLELTFPFYYALIRGSIQLHGRSLLDLYSCYPIETFSTEVLLQNIRL